MAGGNDSKSETKRSRKRSIEEVDPSVEQLPPVNKRATKSEDVEDDVEKVQDVEGVVSEDGVSGDAVSDAVSDAEHASKRIDATSSELVHEAEGEEKPKEIEKAEEASEESNGDKGDAEEAVKESKTDKAGVDEDVKESKPKEDTEETTKESNGDKEDLEESKTDKEGVEEDVEEPKTDKEDVEEDAKESKTDHIEGESDIKDPENGKKDNIETVTAEAGESSKQPEIKPSESSKSIDNVEQTAETADNDEKPTNGEPPSAFTKSTFGSFGSYKFGAYSASNSSFGSFGSKDSGPSVFGSFKKNAGQPSTTTSDNPWAEPEPHQTKLKSSIFGSSQKDEEADESDEENDDTTTAKTNDRDDAKDELYVQVDAPLEARKVETGEEAEQSVFSCRAKLYALDLTAANSGWKERGVGQVHVNVGAKEDGKTTARIVMRSDGVLRVILNQAITKTTEVLSGMKSSLASEKFVRLTGFEGETPYQYALRTGSSDVATSLFDNLQSVLPVD